VLTPIDSKHARVAARFQIGIALAGTPTDVAVGKGSVWVANGSNHSIIKIDPKTVRVTDTIPLGNRPRGIAVGDGLVWAAD